MPITKTTTVDFDNEFDKQVATYDNHNNIFHLCKLCFPSNYLYNSHRAINKLLMFRSDTNLILLSFNLCIITVH